MRRPGNRPAADDLAVLEEEKQTGQTEELGIDGEGGGG